MMHRTEIWLSDTLKVEMMEEALHLSAKHVEALEVQIKRQKEDNYTKEVPQTDVLNDILNRDLV